ncbi:MAG: ABC transporter substrate-binding protein [Proteobacteria bacterium]|nr:ABC transporter substrate-binding protein [Pseudomonadota bacterium]
MKTIYYKTFLLAIILAVICSVGCSKKEAEREIRIGGIFDLTGATHEICVPYADGVRKYIDYVNENGGINGRKVRLIEMDYAYMIPRAKIAYERMVKEDKVHVILGWGTGDTERLRPLIARDHIPFMSASHSSRLGIIEEASYNFLIGVTYSDQMRIVLKYILDQWKEKARKPRVAFIFNEMEFGKSPIPDGKAYAAAHGIDIVAEEIVSLDAREAKEQLLRIKEKKADYAVIQETTWAASVILKNARELGLNITFFGLNWCADEKLIALAGETAEGYIGAMPFLFTDMYIPGVAEIMEYNKRKGIDIEGYISRYIAGWTTARVMLEGIKKAGDDLSGVGIRKGLESIRDFSTGGITAPVTFTAADHKGCKKLRLGQVIRGKWQSITDYLAAD